MRIINVINKLPHHPTRVYKDERAEEIDTAVIHHSASTYIANRSTLEQLCDMARYHIDHHGWPGLSYHYVIDPYGEIFKCNPIERRGYTWHAKGGNDNSIGICLLGNFEETEPTLLQYSALESLIRLLDVVLPRDLKVIGHRDVKGSSTACPGKNFTRERIARLNTNR